MTKLRWRLIVGASIVAVAAGGAGCGGGGSSSGPSTPSTPTATATPRPQTGVNVVVQLRDTAGAPVDGLVTIGDQRRATTGGDASFFNVAAGALTVTAEVNGNSYSQNFNATPGDNTVQISIAPATGGSTGGNPPAPPSF